MYNFKRMMMLNFKIKLILIFGFIFFTGYSQVNIELPVLSPQSPTAGDLGKYGEIQVNESTGKIAPSIPLFEYNAGNFVLPLTLQYNGNGVGVNQDPTWVGINWNLNAGGIITRTVRDKVDENTTVLNGMYYSMGDLNGIPGAQQMTGQSYQTGTEWYSAMTKLSDPAIDSEADIFNYNFLGYSGSFYIKKYLDAPNGIRPQFVVYPIKYDKELLITFDYAVDNNSSFTIKTPEGDTYTFGGPSASDVTRTWVNIGAGSTVSSEYAQNSFYLTKITFFNGGVVNFNYETALTSIGTSVKIGIQEGLKKSSTSGCLRNNVRDVNLTIFRLVKLKTIDNTINNEKVEFTTLSYGQNNRMLKLNEIYLKSGANSAVLLKKIKLIYNTISANEVYANEKKFFLEKVEFYNSADSFEYDYQMIYDSLELFPSKDSFAQDELGYYNGEVTNTSLLPITSNIDLNTCGGLANRDANLYFSKIGSLKRIIYPTGGFTEFTYELPFKGLVPRPPKNVYMSAYYREPINNLTSSENANPPTNRKQFFNILYPVEGEFLELTAAAVVTFKLNVEAYGSFTSHNNSVLISVINGSGVVMWTNELNNVNPPVGLDIDTVGNTSNFQTNYYNPTYTCSLPIGTYYFKLTIDLFNNDANTNNRVTVNLEIGLPNGFRNSYFAGLRVQSITTTPDYKKNPLITRYYYNTALLLDDKSWETYQYHPNYINITREQDSGDSPFAILKDYHNLTSSSLKNPFNMTDWVYQYVAISYGGNHFENGGKQITFKKNSDYPPTFYYTSPQSSGLDFDYDFKSYVNVATNDSYQNSIIEEEMIYGENLTKLKKIKYNYEATTSPIYQTVNNIKLYYFVPESTTIDKYAYLLYRTNSYKYRLMSTETEEYLTPLNPYITKVFYTYDSDKLSLPNKIQTTNSNTEIKTTHIYYPSNVTPLSEAPQITGFTGPETQILQGLQGSNDVAQVIKTEDRVNGILLETKQYAFDSNISTKKPSGIKASKGTDPLEDRVSFLGYNSMGNPTVVSLKNGPKTAYVYNTNQQVVLKIENYNGSILDDGASSGDCYYQDTYLNSLVTKYNYDATNKLIRIVDPKCDIINFKYDTFGRLENIKDKEGNIISENVYYFKP